MPHYRFKLGQTVVAHVPGVPVGPYVIIRLLPLVSETIRTTREKARRGRYGRWWSRRSERLARGLRTGHSSLQTADTIGDGVGSLVGWSRLGGARMISAACALRREFSASVMSLTRASWQASMVSYRV
jgi:hypothetical protein